MPEDEGRRFVMLRHDHPFEHVDFMLEAEGVLRTWRLPVDAWEAMTTGATYDAEAVALADHRMAYFDYEGPVSGGRGTVSRLDRGGYSVISGGRHEDRFAIVLQGGEVCGRVELCAAEGEAWRFRFQAGNAERPQPAVH